MGNDETILAGDGHDPKKRHKFPRPLTWVCRNVTSLTSNSTELATSRFCCWRRTHLATIQSFPVSRLSQETAQLTGVSLQPLPTLLSPQAVSGFTGGSHTVELWGRRLVVLGRSRSFSLASGELHLSTRPPTLGRLWWSSPQPGKPLLGPLDL